MKKIYALLTALVLTIAATGQTLNVKVGSVTYQFPASQTDEMTYKNGTTLTIMGKKFTLADIDAMTIDNSSVKDNNVNVSYEGSTAQITVAGNVAQYVDATVSGAHVSISQTNKEAVDDDEITYTLTGSTTDGELSLAGSYKCTISLAGVTLTNPNGAAINITNKKRIQISAKKGTENTLTDGADGEQKACIYSKGQIQLQGNGTLTVVGNTKHAIKSGDYITVKNLTLNVTKAVGDGISCNKYFQMKSGNVTISGVGDDGIQADFEEDDETTGETEDHEDENSGNVYIEDGTLSLKITAAAAKGIKSAGDMKISGGDITIQNSGAGAYDASPKAIKSDGALTISGGTIVATSANHEAIESKGILTITGGSVYAAGGDDGINSAGDMYLKGGYIFGRTTGSGTGADGFDANGNMYVQGATVFGISHGNPDVAFDANSEGGKKLYLQSGNLVAISGLESGASLTQSCYSTSSYTKGSWCGLYSNGTLVLAFQIPTTGTMGSNLVVSTAGTTELKKGITVSEGTQIWNGLGYVDATVTGGSTVSLSSYTSSGGGGFPGGGGGFPGGGGGFPGWR
jgi:hypothetical protein